MKFPIAQKVLAKERAPEALPDLVRPGSKSAVCMQTLLQRNFTSAGLRRRSVFNTNSSSDILPDELWSRSVLHSTPQFFDTLSCVPGSGTNARSGIRSGSAR